MADEDLVPLESIDLSPAPADIPALEPLSEPDSLADLVRELTEDEQAMVSAEGINPFVDLPIDLALDQTLDRPFDPTIDLAQEQTNSSVADDLVTDDLVTDGLVTDDRTLNDLATDDRATDDLIRDWTSEPIDDLANPLIDRVDESIADLNAAQSDPFSEPLIDRSVAQFDSMQVAPPSGATVEPDHTPRPYTWYLGIDFGTTGLSVVLLNRQTCQLYPIYWIEQVMEPLVDEAVNEAIDGASDASSNALEPNPEPNSAPNPEAALPPPIDRFRLPMVLSLSTDQSSEAVLLRDFKPYLKLGIPHYSPQMFRWEPVLQWSDQVQVPLSWFTQVLQELLTTLSRALPTRMTASTITVQAIGLTTAEFRAAMQQLASVIIGYPVNWSDTYLFNLREAVLGSHLVNRSEQIVFVEDVIATLLSALRGSNDREISFPTHQADTPIYNAAWQGKTLALNAGASVTDLVLVDLPADRTQLTHTDFHLRSLAYAGNGIDQDILCQLLYPILGEQLLPHAVNAPLDYPPSIDLNLEAVTLQDLGLEHWPLPTPGEPDLDKRYRLQQWLESLPSGPTLLEAARYLKFMLQHQPVLTLKLGDRIAEVRRQDFASQVLLPYIQRLNREVNTLMTQTDTAALTVNQVMCSGGTASLPAVARWLKQKFPNATIIQDSYLPPTSLQENCLPSCSRVAYGLATVALHPQTIDRSRQQYSDYFLLLELLRIFPDYPISLPEILARLENRGIDPQACRRHVLALLEGHLPPGLIPPEPEAVLLSPESRQNPDHQAIQLAPLFYPQPDQTYRPNRYQWNHLRRHLDNVMANAQQTLAHPVQVEMDEVMEN